MGQSMSIHSVSPEGQQSEYDIKIVEEINKPKLGKLIIEYCGNEGSTDDEQAASMRKLLQRAITILEPQQEQYPGVWRDAELTIFDLYGNGYVIRSGEGSVKFVVQITGTGDVQLSKVKDESWWTSMKALVWRQNTPQLPIEGPPPVKSNASQRWLLPWPLNFRGSQPEADQAGGLSSNGIEHEQSTSPSQVEPGLENIDTDGAIDGHRSGSTSLVPKDPTPDPREGEDESQGGLRAVICNNRLVSCIKEYTPYLSLPWAKFY